MMIKADFLGTVSLVRERVLVCFLQDLFCGWTELIRLCGLAAHEFCRRRA